MSSEIHAINFNSSRWTTTDARKWMKRNNIIFRGRVNKSEPERFRYTITPSKKYKSFGTRSIPSKGLTFIFGYL